MISSTLQLSIGLLLYDLFNTLSDTLSDCCISLACCDITYNGIITVCEFFLFVFCVCVHVCSVQDFHQMCDETRSWIGEKDQALSTDDCGRDLASVQALQRRHQVRWYWGIARGVACA